MQFTFLLLIAVILKVGTTSGLTESRPGNGSELCVSREEFERTRAETEALKKELNSWQNTTISILKSYLIDQGVGKCSCATDIKQLWEKMDRVQDNVAANNASVKENTTLQEQLLQHIQSSEQRILMEQNRTLQEVVNLLSQKSNQQFQNGTFQNPVPSCKYIQQDSPSGSYWVQRSTTGYARQVYCDMTARCSSTGGWMRVADFNMTNTLQLCPQGFRTITSPRRLCGKSGPGCASTTFQVHGVSYQKVCGKVTGYQYYTPDAFGPYYINRAITIDGTYIDGVSITHGGHPRKHVWSFAAVTDELHVNQCPCTKTDATFTGVVPLFVGQDYFCDTGSRYQYQNRIYSHDPLWDGSGCGSTSSCCRFNSPPWFCKQLPQPTTDDIELRLCHDESTGNEDVLIELVELYVQ